MTARTIAISEVFGPTIQGEGALIGKPTIFIRTGGCDYRCLAPDTPVTMHDLTQRPIQLLQPGDMVLGYARVGEATQGPLRLVPTPVIAVRALDPEPTLRLMLEDGTELLCSLNHRWWVERKGWVWKSPKRLDLEGNYREAQKIKVGDYIKGFGAAICQPRETDLWRRGAFDGDGHISKAWIAMRVTSRTFFDAVVSISERVGVPLAEYAEGITTHGTSLYRSRLPEVYRETFIEAIKWQEDKEFARGMNQRRLQVVNIEVGPVTPLFDIQTGTGNFLAYGMVSHNCSWCDTLYAVLPEHKSEWQPLTTEQVFAEVQRLSAHTPLLVTLSGGNPAIQPLEDLIDLGHSYGYTFAIETQGSVAQPWFAKLDYLTLSPKPPSSKQITRWDRLDRCVAFAWQYKQSKQRAKRQHGTGKSKGCHF